ncbi:transposase [Ktedonobacter sp. SOSP1-52]|nr:transposase [Ktedonobacter sp. SOSP1-52]
MACSARGQTGAGNITIHDRKRQRYRCTRCHKTFSQRRGTMVEGLRKPTELIVIVVTLLSYGCPIQAIVHAFGLDERTVASWRDRAGAHCQRVHQDVVETGQLDLTHVQADEIRVKGCKIIAWMGLAMMVSTRLWLAGAVRLSRDRKLADVLLQQVRRCSQTLKALLVGTDGWAAYPGSIKRAFREKVKLAPGRGRACLHIWPDLHIGTVIKRTEKKHVVEVTRNMSHGSQTEAERLLHQSAGGSVLNTAFIERLNGTMRQRLATLTRKCRHSARRLRPLETGMYLIGTTYNFCWPHQELSKSTHMGRACTPAMAAGLTDHIWCVGEVLQYKVAPSPWVEPKRRGRRKKQADLPVPSVKQSSHRPLVRLRQGQLCSTTG